MMVVAEDDLVACPHCHNGLVVAPLPGGSDLCLLCGGLGRTLRHVRCQCGRQVNLKHELRPRMYFCGRPRCAEIWLKNLPVETEVQCCRAI
jgi:hypothetical protein